MTGKALLAASALALAAVVGGMKAHDARAQDVTLEFVVWNYSLETIQDNVAKFEAENPGIKVNVTDYTWPDYHDTMVLRLRGDTQTDVIYAGQDWLPSWASAGWLVPLEEYFPEVAQYKDKTTDYALSDMTYNGQLYGLSYYADIISFVYNKQILDQHGIEVPQTWDDVLAASLKLKEAGMEKPIVYEYN
jgi:multiple sugar transport system substrate-binding protein